jgi:hypothetical protein
MKSILRLFLTLAVSALLALVAVPASFGAGGIVHTKGDAIHAVGTDANQKPPGNERAKNGNGKKHGHRHPGHGHHGHHHHHDPVESD